MTPAPVDFNPLRNALAQLAEAIVFWQDRAEGDPLKPHLRSAVIQSFEFTYELALRTLRRVLVERSESADLIKDLSFSDLIRSALDAGLPSDLIAWRRCATCATAQATLMTKNARRPSSSRCPSLQLKSLSCFKL